MWSPPYEFRFASSSLEVGLRQFQERFSVDAEVQYVVDLTKDEMLRTLGVTPEDLTKDWRAIDIGAAARAAGVATDVTGTR